MAWNEFEKACENYLNNNYGDRAIFILEGGSNSNISDIAVEIDGRVMFYIEVKMGSAQSGQFVVLPDVENECFFFSPRNKSDENEFTRIILSYINDNYDAFLNAGTAGEDIDVDKQCFSQWIINHYRNRGVKYIITYNNGFIIFPVEAFMNYFDISATMRNKGSGSSQPAKKNWSAISSYIGEEYNVSNTEHLIDGKKKRLLAYTNRLVDKETFVVDSLTYQFSARDEDDEYEVRKLNRKTKNPTVVFRVHIKTKQEISDLELFEEELL